MTHTKQILINFRSLKNKPAPSSGTKNTQVTSPLTILITGASSGLGAALACHYAQAGVTLHLQGRNQARLQEVATICEGKHATVYTQIADVIDAAAMEQWMLAADAKTPVDLIIANAGVSAGTGIHGEGSDQVRHIFSTNIGGTINTIQPLLDVMVQRKSGQI